ncbi:MAG: hypothetical protein HYS52_01705 [Candidatus Wildermuthbacteria bacterium]|nr:hypothetical protein [Candidatus Wildermuthbacteria bacterium]
MSKGKLPKSLRKYIRLQKAHIRREVFTLAKQQELIDELYRKVLPMRRTQQSEQIVPPLKQAITISK